MVSIKHARFFPVLLVLSMFGGCSSGPDPREQPKEQQADIYDQLRNDNVQYATEERGVVKGSPEYVINNLAEVRVAYFAKNYDKAKKLSKRILSLVPSTPEAYYWLARIYYDEGDFGNAYNMSTRGLTFAKEANMKAELERLQMVTQMGAN